VAIKFLGCALYHCLVTCQNFTACDNGRHTNYPSTRLKRKTMNKDKEPEHLASIALSREEIASRQRVTKPVRSTKATHSAGTSKALWALTVFALLLSGALLVQFQQVKKQSDLQLQAITILQAKLTNTDEQSNLSVDAIKIMMKDQDHEIRKLWDIANKQNKKNIRKNKERLDDQSKMVTRYTGKIDLMSKDLVKQEKSLSAGITRNKSETQTALKQIQSKIDVQQSKVEKSIKSLPKNLAKTLKNHDKAIAAFPKGVSKTLKDHEKGLKAMDATRLQLMKRINALDKEIKLIKKAQASKPSVPVITLEK